MFSFTRNPLFQGSRLQTPRHLYVVTCWYCGLVSLACLMAFAASASLNLGGRMEVDAAHYWQDLTPLNDGVILRRARLDISGKFKRRWSFYVQTDLKNARNELQLAWVKYRFDRRNSVQLGKVEMPFSLESVSNSKLNLFMERALPMALTERFGTGAVYLHQGKNWNFRFGAFGDDHFRLGGQTDYGQSVAARWGLRQRWGKSRTYLGASVFSRQPDRELRFRARPESTVDGRRLIDTRAIAGITRVNKWGLEALWKTRRWVMQAEVIRNDVSRRQLPDLSFHGAYLAVGRTFHGQRRFSFRRGEWARMDVRPGKTWELAGRVSWLDLADADLNGGSQTNLTLGINWYPVKTGRVMLNWVHAIAHPNRLGRQETPDLLQMRLQYEF
jgi:phosphate-selective porin OprO/OprP